MLGMAESLRKLTPHTTDLRSLFHTSGRPSLAPFFVAANARTSRSSPSNAHRALPLLEHDELLGRHPLNIPQHDFGDALLPFGSFLFRSMTTSRQQLPYHTLGIRRYRTLCIYAAYPGKFFRRRFSSSRIRQTSTGKNGATRRTLNQEPSARGIAVISSKAPEYIGCRTYAYGPVDTTGCPSST